MFNFFNRGKNKIQNPSILICGIGNSPYFEQDKSIYEPYQNVTEFKAYSLEIFENFIQGKTFDIVHLFVDFDSEGKVGDEAGIRLLQLLTKANNKLVIFASPNSIEDYNAAFPTKEQKGIDNMHTVLTLNRKDDNFTNFFRAMFALMAQGKSMPMAWVSLAPQHDGPWMKKMPDCLFKPNQGHIKFVP